MTTELTALLIADHDIVDIVPDGLTLIEAVRRHRPDVIVSDIAMPGINGLAAAANIVARQPDARIVLVTVQDSRAVIKKAFDCGVRGFVLKSDAGGELVAAVRVALSGGIYLSSGAQLALRKRGTGEEAK
jgi:DNA-binding NarL/FixJ family response regulator